MNEKHLTLCIIYREDQVLLGFKKRGFGKNRWNGFGGKVEPGETVLQAALREVEEEIKVVPQEIKERGILRFTFEHETEELVGHLFSAYSFVGSPQETEEMRPHWFDISEVPYDDMWPDDRFWLPHFLAGKSVNGSFHFKDHDTLLSQNLTFS